MPALIQRLTIPEKYVLAHVPRTARIRALRVWDSKGEALPREVLDDFPQVPGTLEYLAWEGKEKNLYKLVREDGKIKAVISDALWKRSNAEEGEIDWSEERILDY